MSDPTEISAATTNPHESSAPTTHEETNAPTTPAVPAPPPPAPVIPTGWTNPFKGTPHIGVDIPGDS